MSWSSVEPLPSSGWIRWAPKEPVAAAEPYLDLPRRRIVWPGEGEEVDWPTAPPEEPDLVYLPPAASGDDRRRARLARKLSAAGLPYVAHDLAVRIGRAGGHPDVRVVDLLSTWLERDAEAGRLSALPAERLWVVLPLVAGLTPEAAALELWLESLTALAPAAVIGVAPELTPSDRRRLADRLGEGAFEAVFHGQPPAERSIVRGLSERGLTVRIARPRMAALPPRAARNRALAGALAECGELWLKLDRAESEGVALLAAARHLERCRHDVAAVAREGNLALLDFLGPLARRVVEENVEELPGGLLRELRALWSGRLW